MAIDATDLFEVEDKRQPWHRQIKISPTGRKVIESKQAHDALKLYCLQQGRRSLRKVAQELSKSAALIARWSGSWNWRERVLAYDRFADELETTAFILERKSMGRRQANLAVAGQNVAARALMALQNEAAGQSVKLSDAVRLFDVCSRVERLCRGNPDQDTVAQIHVTISQQSRPRYEEFAEARAAGQDLDKFA